MVIGKKLGVFIAAIAPGIFLVGYNIGTGSITTMASAGADYGMMMTWPLLLSCIFTYVLIITFGKYTAVTGETALSSFRRHFGSAVTLFILASLLFSEWVSAMGVMGIIVQVVHEWSRPITPGHTGFNSIVLAALFGALLYLFFWNGKHKVFEKILAFFVFLMGLSFVLTMFMVIPDPGEVIAGLVPRIPKGTNALLLMAGMVGTTMGAILYVVRSILVQEEGWGVEDLKKEKKDALFASSMMFLLSVAVMASAAGTLYPAGLHIENAIDMVKLMEPLAGRFAVSVFVTGIVSAGLSSLFPIILLAPWLFADYSNRPRNMRSLSSRLLVLFGVLLGLVIPVFGGRPVLIMIVAMALTSIASPLVIGLMILLVNKKKVMGEYTPSTAFNILLVIIFLFTLFVAGAGMKGIAGLF